MAEEKLQGDVQVKRIDQGIGKHSASSSSGGTTPRSNWGWLGLICHDEHLQRLRSESESLMTEAAKDLEDVDQSKGLKRSKS